jgi:hypothetical protein
MDKTEGYAKIATLMSYHEELSIFKRFARLTYQNLLYLQAELTHLEADLDQLVERDGALSSRAAYASHWWHLAQSDEDHDNGEQWDKVVQIRKKLKEYRMGLFLL